MASDSWSSTSATVYFSAEEGILSRRGREATSAAVTNGSFVRRNRDSAAPLAEGRTAVSARRSRGEGTRASEESGRAVARGTGEDERSRERRRRRRRSGESGRSHERNRRADRKGESDGAREVLRDAHGRTRSAVERGGHAVAAAPKFNGRGGGALEGAHEGGTRREKETTGVVRKQRGRSGRSGRSGRTDTEKVPPSWTRERDDRDEHGRETTRSSRVKSEESGADRTGTRANRDRDCSERRREDNKGRVRASEQNSRDDQQRRNVTAMPSSGKERRARDYATHEGMNDAQLVATKEAARVEAPSSGRDAPVESPLRARKPDREVDIHAEVLPVYKLIYNNSFREADAALAGKQRDTPRLALAHALAAVWRATHTGALTDRLKALADSQAAIALATSTLKSKAQLDALRLRLPESVQRATAVEANVRWDTELVLAEGKLYEAMCLLQTGSYLKGGVAFRACYKKYEAVQHEIDKSGAPVMPAVRCALRFGLGVFCYIMSFVDKGGLSFILKMLGFNADGELGVAYLREAAEFCGINDAFAGVCLAASNLFMPRGFGSNDAAYKEAEATLTALEAEYPRGAVFQMMNSHMYRKLGDGGLALRAAQASVELTKEAGLSVPKQFVAGLAECQLYNLEYDRAIATLEGILALEGAFDMEGLCYVNLAGAYAMVGRETEAFDKLRRVAKVATSKQMPDQIARALGDQCLKTGEVVFITIEGLYVKRELHRMKPALLARVEEELNRVATSTRMAKPDCAAMVLLLRGCIAQGQGRPDDAEKHFQSALQLEGTALLATHVFPHARYELAEMWYRQGRKSQALEQIKILSKYSGYAFEQFLSKRISTALKQVAKEVKKGT